jgi:hypothetical protein
VDEFVAPGPCVAADSLSETVGVIGNVESDDRRERGDTDRRRSGTEATTDDDGHSECGPGEFEQCPNTE